MEGRRLALEWWLYEGDRFRASNHRRSYQEEISFNEEEDDGEELMAMYTAMRGGIGFGKTMTGQKGGIVAMTEGQRNRK